MASPVSVRLLPDPDQHDLLAATLERVNKASNLARTRALEQGVSARGPLRAVVKEELEARSGAAVQDDEMGEEHPESP